MPPRCASRDSDNSGAMAPGSPVSLLPPAFLPNAPPLHRLVMTSPHGSVSPMVSSSSSPPMLMPVNSMASPRSPSLHSPSETDPAALDFSTKKGSDGSGLDLSKGSPVPTGESSPLDLSVSSRKRGQDDSSCGSQSPSPQPRKTPRISTDFKTVVSPWTSPVVASHFPYFAAAAAVAAANSLSPKLNNNLNSHSSSDSSLWNGKLKVGDKPPFTTSPVDATKALEKMSELSKLGGDEFRSMGNSGAGGRHSAWQSHWLNKGADQAKDVLKCVWCKQSFPSLAAMTTHMKEAKHCGVNVPVPNIQPPPPPMPQPPQIPTSSIPPSSLPNLSSSKPSPADLNLLIKETMPLPRKLVRGQDVWLGKGAEQTRQILKCMWCGQSFRSLAEMTSHMQQTQHYTNIISQEQIISWKSAEEGKSSSGGGGGRSTEGSGSTGGSAGGGSVSSAGGGATSSHVNAVFTCKVCDQAFNSLKELSNHMVKNSHYKEHIMRSITESGGRRRQTREKRKKSLPVRKLLELERAQNELKNGEGGLMMMGKMARDMHAAGRITCEKCGEKIDMAVFVDHIRMCIGGGHISSDQRNLLKSALLSNNLLPPEHQASVTQALRESRKTKKEDSQMSPTPTDLSATPTSPNKDSSKQEGKSSSPSVLNAIEKLIEKSFDSRNRHSQGYGGPGGMGQGHIGSSILKRLGIDESVDYTKPLVDPQTMNLLRNYPHHPHGHFGRRERSGSESSSMSERGRTEASTPDRKFDPSDRFMSSTPRTTPEKRIQTPPSARNSIHDESIDDEVHIKKEMDDEGIPLESNMRHDIVVKKEQMENGDDEDERRSYHSESHMQRSVKEEPLMSPRNAAEELEEGRRSHNSMVSPGLSPRQPTPVRPASNEAVPSSPCRNSTSSPASSDRSGTPRSTTDKKSTGSLGALSSMFDNLSGGHPGGGGGAEPTATGGKGTSHPLAALQKLCDKTETHHHPSTARPSSSNQGPSSMGASSSQTPQSATTPGAILAFSWACNDAVVTADSIMKCAFCDTPFISKGAYRHHLSKMHFVKDGVIPDPVALKAQAGGSGASQGNHSGKSSSSASTSGKSPNQQNNFEESPHSKFLKYTELAKQLSSKYV